MTPLLGVDLSEHQATLPEAIFDRLAAHGCGFLISRASRGSEYQDPTLPRFLRLAETRGWVTGAYHFMEKPTVGGTGLSQAESYLASIDRADPTLHVLDTEVAGITWLQVVEFVERLRREGLRVGVYTRESWWQGRFPTHPRLGLFDFEWLAIWDQPRHVSTWDLKPHASPGLVQFGALRVPDGAGKTWSMDGNLWHGTRSQLAGIGA